MSAYRLKRFDLKLSRVLAINIKTHLFDSLLVRTGNIAKEGRLDFTEVTKQNFLKAIF